MKQKIAIIGTVGLPAKYGGFETLAAHLTKQLEDQFDFSVYCSGAQYKKTDRNSHLGKTRLHYIPLKANGIQSILYDTLSILHAWWYADVLLVLGVAGAWTFPIIRLLTKKRIIVSIDGIEWKRDKWNLLAKWFLWCSEQIAVKYSHVDISDNESIQDYTAMRYGTLSRVVEYGADHVMSVKVDAQDIVNYPFLNTDYTFKVCRIEPENNLEMVLSAFALLPKHNLVVVGNWNNNAFGKRMRLEYGNLPNIYLIDPIYDQRSLDLLRSNATAYVHGHSAGGTNPSLIEAMYLGLPVLAFDVSYNRTTTEGNALYFDSQASLLSLVENLRPDTLKEKGAHMQAIAKRRYTWALVANRYKLLVDEAIEGKPKHKVAPQIGQLQPKVLEMGKVAHMKHVHIFFDQP